MRSVLKLVSSTDCECSTWILCFSDARLAYTILGAELSVQYQEYNEQFVKKIEQFDLNIILY